MTRLSTGESRRWMLCEGEEKIIHGDLAGELNLLVERKFIDQVDELFKELVTHVRRPLWM